MLTTERERVIVIVLTPAEVAELERLGAHVGVSADDFAARIITKTLPLLAARRRSLIARSQGGDCG